MLRLLQFSGSGRPSLTQSPGEADRSGPRAFGSLALRARPSPVVRWRDMGAVRRTTLVVVALTLIALGAMTPSALAAEHGRAAAPAPVTIDGYTSEDVEIPTRDG